MSNESKLASLLGRRDRFVPMTLELPNHPGKKLGLRPLTESDVECAHARAISHVRALGFVSENDGEAAASLSKILDTKDGRSAVKHRAEGLSGALAVIATSELGYAIQCEELTLALCDPKEQRPVPLVTSSDELRETLEREEVEWLGAKLEQWMRDRAPQRVHLTRQQIKEVVSAAKKGQKPTILWNSCAYSTLLDFVTIMAETLVTCGGATSASSTPDGVAPSP